MTRDLYLSRLNAVRQKLDIWEVDALLVTGYANYRWLSGFTGSNGKLLVSSDKAILATDSRYYGQAQQQSAHFTLFKHERRSEDDSAFLAEGGAKTMGLESSNISLKAADDLKAAAPAIKWQPLKKTIEPLRQIKTAAELKKIKAAAEITDLVMSQVAEIIKPGMREKQVAWELEKSMREAGADGMAFNVKVASGPNSALPHHAPGSRKIAPGDAIIIDMGAMVDGYRSDMTRTFFMGSEPTPKFMEIYETVLAAQTAVLMQAKSGMFSRSVDAIARDLIAQAGYKENFGHGLGHGVGLEIHEDPFLSPRTAKTEKIETGMTLTVEPGIYIPGWGGVRIEDLTVVQADGLDRISQCPKNPIIPMRAAEQ